jgi:hypothetical protein
MLKLRTILVHFSLLLFAVLIHAQGTVQASLQAGQGGGVGSGSGNGTARVEATGMVGGGVETFYSAVESPGQPFSADTVDETDKFLADGNHIHRETHGKVFRDSQGRTRTETEIERFIPGSDPLLHITIIDPVEGRFIVLDPQNKTAMVNFFEKHWANPEPVTSKPAAKPGLSTSATASHAPGLSAVAGQTQGGQNSMNKRSVKELGTMAIEGFTATGVRFHNTTAAGAMGNDKPMMSTNERWYSSDLKMALLTISESPESGKHVHKLVNIQTGDPDPLLFQVPADFTLRETPQK